MDSVFTHFPIMPDLLTQDVELGIGTTRSASLAPTDGFSTLTTSVFQFLTNARPTLPTETVPLASRDTTSRKDNVFSLTSTTPSPLTQDVQHGIGMSKFVLLAPVDGFSTSKKFVFPFLIYVKLTLPTETVPLVTKDMTLRKDNAFTLTLIMLAHLISDVPLGTGKTKSA